MHLIEKGKKGAEPVHMDWDQAQAALRTGKYEIDNEGPEADGDRSEDKLVPDLDAAGRPAVPLKDAKAP